MKWIDKLWMLMAGACAVANAQDTPSLPPPPEMLRIPLPAGQSMEFALVRVFHEAESPANFFAVQRFDVGRALDADIYERKAPTSVAGTVFIPKSREAGYWVLPVARTELTRAQYAAVMCPEKMPAEAEAQLPMTGLSQVKIMQFLEKLNQWLYASRQQHPEVKKMYARLCQSKLHGVPYLRLLTETEWEYVARGAAHVTRERLNNPHPYADMEALVAAENLATRTGKAARMRPVAKGACNPCGLYDMLGNAEEMVLGEFRPEYHFGRVGGLLVRGSSYAEVYENAASYKRRECPVVSSEQGGVAYSDELVGCRLVFGAQIAPNRVPVQILANQWKEYWNQPGQVNPRPKESSTDSLSRKLHAAREEMKDDMQKLGKLQPLDTSAEKQQKEVEAKLRDLQGKLKDMDKLVMQAHERMARSGLLIIDCFSYTALESLVRIRLNLKSLGAFSDKSDMHAQLSDNIKQLEQSVLFDWQKVCEGYETLVVADASAFEVQLKARRDSLLKHPDQLQTFDLAVRHFRLFQQKSGTLSEQSFHAWREDLDKLAKQIVSRK